MGRSFVGVVLDDCRRSTHCGRSGGAGEQPQCSVSGRSVSAIELTPSAHSSRAAGSTRHASSAAARRGQGLQRALQSNQGGVPRHRLHNDFVLSRQFKYRGVVGDYLAFHCRVAIAPRMAHQAGQQLGSESAAAPIFGHGDRELASLATPLIRANVLRGAYDVNAVGCRNCGDECEVSPRPGARRVQAPRDRVASCAA